jgi:RND family efflux transporter MFP subunit
VQAQAAADAAAVPLNQSIISAPFSGIVTQKFVDAGAVVSPGSPIVALQGTADLELDVPVPEELVRELSPGAPVAVRVDALGGLSVPGRIRAIVPADNPALRAIMLKISVPARRDLLSGMFARIDIHQRTQPTQVVPAQAVVVRAGQAGVFLVRGNIATFRPVKTGASGGGLVAVQGVVGVGSRVAVSNLQRLDDGTAVADQP